MENDRRRNRSASSQRDARPADAARRRERAASAPQEKRRNARERDSRAAQAAQRQREERRERDSRAAQEAQRRREERKERERLDELREKQKRKAKRRTRKRISPGTWKRLLIMAGVVVAVVLSMVIFFRVRTIEVRGNRYYSAEEVVQSAGVADGDNLFTVSRGEVAGSIMAQLPYVRNVRVTRSLPDTLILTVTEYDTTYAVQDSAEDWYLITADGKVTEKIEEREASAHIIVEAPKINTPEIGQIVTVAAAEEETVTAEGQLHALTQLLSEIEAAGLSQLVTSVNIPASYDVSLQYEDRFLVRLGNAEELAYKLEYLKVVVAQQKDYTTGTIDLSFSEGNEARVTPNE